MSNFTKGLWLIRKSEWTADYDVYVQPHGDPCEYVIAEINYVGGNEESRHNANLIAAAPDLYEAIEEALSCVTDMGIKQQMINALEKARGET